MPSSTQRLILARDGITFYCSEIIMEKWKDQFDVWLSIEAHDDIADGYKRCFKKPYQEYMTPVLKNLILTCSMHTVIAIRSYIKSVGTPRLDEILQFTNEFIRQQLSEFESMCIESGIDVGDDL